MAYETYAYIDLGELTNRLAEEGDLEAAGTPDAERSCSGKVLLLVTRSGMEIVRVPAHLH
jgi:hypothetical protein